MSYLVERTCRMKPRNQTLNLAVLFVDFTRVVSIGRKKDQIVMN